MEDLLNNLTRTVKHDAMTFCAKAAAMHACEGKSVEYNQAALDIAAKLLELAGPTQTGSAA